MVSISHLTRVFLILRFALAYSHRSSLRGSGSSNGHLLCHIQVVVQATPASDEREERGWQTRKELYECTPHGEQDLSYSIQLSDDFIHEHKTRIADGSLFVSIPGGTIADNSRVAVPEESEMHVVTPPEGFQPRRLTQAATGNRTVLVVRVSSTDAQPAYDADEFHNYIFGEDDVTLKSQYAACSFDQLILNPTSHGVMDIRVPVRANGASHTTLVNSAKTILSEVLGNPSSLHDVADHIMLCLPPGSGRWAAMAPLNGIYSYYNDHWCASLSANMHEIGHNLGLRHANQGIHEYTDFTGYMSGAFSVKNWPAKCFNGANNWDLGWYNDKSIEIQPAAGPQLVKIVTFVDYDQAEPADSEYVVVKIGDIYLQYNRQKGMNIETQDKLDQLTVVESRGNRGTYLLAGLDRGTPRFEFDNLVVEVCGVSNNNHADYMVVSIGSRVSLCGELHGAFELDTPIPTPPPTTPSPTNSPTPSPTPRPTPSPTTASPTTPSPTANPTISMAPTFDNGQVCDDSPTETFYVNQTHAGETLNEHKTCIWLKARPQWQAVLCREDHEAYSVCPETCGACTDACEDDAEVMFDVNGSNRNCEWLSLRHALWPEQCVEGTAAYDHCKETCNSCVDAVTASPREASFAPISEHSPSSDNCDDTPFERFFVSDEEGEQTCVWLAARPEWQQILCVEGHDANSLCPETCGVCTDACEDDGQAQFQVGSANRNCQWLSIRPALWETYCVPGQVPYSVCRETCETCSRDLF